MSHEELRAALAGVVAITVTPFGPDGEPDETAHAKLVDRLLTGGIPVITPNGNTSEFYALSPAETERMVDLTVQAVAGRAAVLCGVGHDLATAIDAARYAHRAGATGIMIHQPVHPYLALDGWVDYHRAIADAVPDLGVVLYMRNPRIGGAQLAALGAACPNVVGVKFAMPDPVRFATVARDAGLDRFTWVAGMAELSAPGYRAVGAHGFTSGLANVAPELAVRMQAALTAGDYPEAMRAWELIRPFEEMRAAGESADNVSVVKEALAQLGLCGRAVRPPSRELDAAGRARVGAILATWGLRVEHQ
ncbi:MAG TPA: dihydrodipicolinate synthase family protein [Actinophytocola sp.]|uniref:dihydrodipicolinate synthase family protein n=1 Tax=Actinophytocola sp. TaxID=1872138 RepID=UPI002DBF72C7|nr:dihydrodipicolinate synthase family protein [Actinophytocola sp.]HEU5469781.1 dihydrodipicolinate synthase family protein [Actinophytocola sp.]